MRLRVTFGTSLRAAVTSDTCGEWSGAPAVNTGHMSSIGGTTTSNGPSSTTEQAKEKAQEGAQQAKRSVRDQVDQRSTQAGERVGSTARDMRGVGEELRNQGKEQPAKLAEQAAQRADALGDYLKRSDGD